jgi:hypothetical protein
MQAMWVPLGRPATGSHPVGKSNEAGNRRGSLIHRPQPASRIAVQLSPAHMPRAHSVCRYWPTPRTTQAPRNRSARARGQSRLPAHGSNALVQSRRAVLVSAAYGNARSLRSLRAPFGREALRPTVRTRGRRRGGGSPTSDAVRWRAITSSSRRYCAPRTRSRGYATHPPCLSTFT